MDRSIEYCLLDLMKLQSRLTVLCLSLFSIPLLSSGNALSGIFLDDFKVARNTPGDQTIGVFSIHMPAMAGVKKWEFTAGDWVESSAAIGLGGTVYFGSSDHKVYAFDG